MFNSSVVVASSTRERPAYVAPKLESLPGWSSVTGVSLPIGTALFDTEEVQE
jgi:hypothetical protein